MFLNTPFSILIFELGDALSKSLLSQPEFGAPPLMVANDSEDCMHTHSYLLSSLCLIALVVVQCEHSLTKGISLWFCFHRKKKDFKGPWCKKKKYKIH